MNLNFSSFVGDWLDTLLTDIAIPIAKGVIGAIAPILYGLQVGLFYILDAIQGVVKKLVGIEPHYQEINGEYYVSKEDPALTFLEEPAVQNTFASVLIASLFLLIITTFVAIIKTELNKESNSKTAVIESAIKGLAYFLVVPVACYLGIFISNVVLKMLDSATSRGAANFSNQIFVAAATKANRILDEEKDATAYAMNIYSQENFTASEKSGITDTQRREYIESIVDKMNSSARIYRGTLSNTDRGKTGYVYAIPDELFAFNSKSNSDFNLNYQMEKPEDTSARTYTFKFKYTPADGSATDGIGGILGASISGGVIPSTLRSLEVELSKLAKSGDVISSRESMFVGSSGISFYNLTGSTDEEIWKSMANVKANTGSDGQLPEGNYVFVKTLPVVNSFGNFLYDGDVDMSSYAQNTGSFWINFFSGQLNKKPKDPQVQIEFNGKTFSAYVYYRSDFHLEGIIPIIGGKMMDTHLVIEVEGDFDRSDYQKLATFIDNMFRTGRLDILTYSTVASFYDMSEYNYLVGYLGGALIVTMLLHLMIGCIQRIFEIAVLFVLSPIAVSLMPLDQGERFKKWREEFIKRVFSAYGPILGMNLAFMVLEVVCSTSLKFFPADQAIFNYIIDTIIMFTALVCIKSTTKMVTDLVGQGDAMEAGKKTSEDLKKVGMKTAGAVSNAAVMPYTLGKNFAGAAMGNKRKADTYNGMYAEKDAKGNLTGNVFTEEDRKRGYWEDSKGVKHNINAASYSKADTVGAKWSSMSDADKQATKDAALRDYGLDLSHRANAMAYVRGGMTAHRDLLTSTAGGLFDDEAREKFAQGFGKGTALENWLSAPLNAKKDKKLYSKTLREAAINEAAMNTLNKDREEADQFNITNGFGKVHNSGGSPAPSGDTGVPGPGGSGSGGSGGGGSGGSGVRDFEEYIEKLKSGDETAYKDAISTLKVEIDSDSSLTNTDKKALKAEVDKMNVKDLAEAMTRAFQNGDNARDAVRGNPNPYSDGYKNIESKVIVKGGELKAKLADDKKFVKAVVKDISVDPHSPGWARIGAKIADKLGDKSTEIGKGIAKSLFDEYNKTMGKKDKGKYEGIGSNWDRTVGGS